MSFVQMFDESSERFARHSPWGLMESVPAELFDQLPIRIVIGTGDFLLNANELFHDRLVARGYYHEFFVLKDIPHSIGQLFERVGIDGLKFHARAGGWQ
jgi:hypothetical protein